eukprot:755381-Hanusia_phi.AAC.3
MNRRFLAGIITVNLGFAVHIPFFLERHQSVIQNFFKAYRDSSGIFAPACLLYSLSCSRAETRSASTSSTQVFCSETTAATCPPGPDDRAYLTMSLHSSTYGMCNNLVEDHRDSEPKKNNLLIMSEIGAFGRQHAGKVFNMFHLSMLSLSRRRMQPSLGSYHPWRIRNFLCPPLAYTSMSTKASRGCGCCVRLREGLRLLASPSATSSASLVFLAEISADPLYLSIYGACCPLARSPLWRRGGVMPTVLRPAYTWQDTRLGFQVTRAATRAAGPAGREHAGDVTKADYPT